jgi:hypothetical protein
MTLCAAALIRALGAYTNLTMKRLYILTFIMLLMFGCSKSGTIEQRIGRRLDDCKSAEACIIKIRDLTDFQWDKMCAFEYEASLDQIEKALGTKFPDYVEFKRRMVFLKDGKIVHREDEPTDIEGLVNGQVSFGESYTNPVWSLTPDTAVFTGKKEEFSGGIYYVLTQVK